MRIRLKRRRFGQIMISGTVLTVLGNLTSKTWAQVSPHRKPVPTQAPEVVDVTLRVNGTERNLKIEPCVTLLDALNDHLNLTGTKKGCDRGQCGACTVLVNGQRINSCLSLAIMYEDAEITTVEGLAKGNQLHPIQAAFIKHDGFQCGYCTPGQVCSAVAAIAEAKAGTASAVTSDVRKQGQVELTAMEISERMSGNICRCGAYRGIVAAVQEVSQATAS